MRKTGVVKVWKDGWGFIKPEGHGDPDIFVHHSEIKTNPRELRKGQAVSFVIKQTPKGLQAAEVRPLDAADATETNWPEYIGVKPFPKKDFD